MTAFTSTQMTCDDASDLLSGYALDILEPGERAAVSSHVNTCADCRLQLEQFALVTDALATAPPPFAPPSTVRARLLESIYQTPAMPLALPEPPLISQARTNPSSLTLPRWAIWPIAAAAIALIAGIAVLTLFFTDARKDRDDAQATSSKLAAYLSAGGQVTKLSAATTDGNYYGHGSLVTAPEMPPLVIVGGCSPSSSNRVYRVWMARGDDRTRVGELKVNDSGSGWLEVELDESLTSFDSIGITMVTNGDQRQDVLVANVAQTSAT